LTFFSGSANVSERFSEDVALMRDEEITGDRSGTPECGVAVDLVLAGLLGNS
jgi:hypothetical protein